MKIMNPREEERNRRGATRREGRGSSQDVSVCLGDGRQGRRNEVGGGHTCFEKFARLNPQTSFVGNTTLSELSGLNLTSSFTY